MAIRAAIWQRQFLVIVGLLVGLLCQNCFGQVKSGLKGEPTTDPTRKLQTLNGYFPFDVPESLEAWQTRRKKLRQHLQVSLGLWPMPKKTPLKAVVHGRREMDGYSIEKVYFESMPGFYVTGNLYRPLKSDGKKLPGILCPHGHWSNGRFMWNDDKNVKKQIDEKGEKHASNARSPLQSRCATLAQKGCVVFHYDMIGYADSQQVPHSIAHGFAKQRASLNSHEAWGLFSAQAEMRSQSVMGLQTWNSIRSLDFLESLPDVDPGKIGVTGASGGGTQTFILCAIDPRPAAAFPAVMVSTAMQGGCTCENCCNLRVEQGNVEWAAMFAPKPMALTAANDWTREMDSKGMPELKQLYGLYGQSEKVSLLSRTEFGHNYNRVSRTVMYDWFHKHLGLTNLEPEPELVTLRKKDLTVFDSDHPAPRGGEDWEKEFMAKWSARDQKQMSLANVKYADDAERMYGLYRVAFRRLVNLDSSQTGLKMVGSKVNTKLQSRTSEATLYSKGHSLKTRVLLVEPNRAKKTSHYCIYLNKNGLPLSGDFSSYDDVDTQKVFLNQANLIGLDLVGQSSKRGVDQSKLNRLVPNGREAAGYTFGYNRTVFAWRIQQVHDLIRYLKESEPECTIDIFADNATMPLALYAGAISEKNAIRSIVTDNQNFFRFAKINNLKSTHFVPGIVKFGDIDGLVTLAILNGVSLWISGESKVSLPNATRVSRLMGRGHEMEQGMVWRSFEGKMTKPKR